MTHEFSPEQQDQLVDVTEVLFASFGQVTLSGVLIEQSGRLFHNVRYSDPAKPHQPIREMSSHAYVAEFYKVCGKSLDDANFDQFLAEVSFVGDLLSNPMTEVVGLDMLRPIAATSGGNS